MAVAFVSNANTYNLDPSVNPVVVPFVAALNQCIVVHIGVRSATAIVGSVTDNFGNVYTRQGSILAQDESDYTLGRYSKAPLLFNKVEGECWTTRSGGAVASVTVTMSGLATTAIVINSYTGSGFGAANAVTAVQSSTPTATLTTTASNSFISAGFSTATLLNEATTAGHGTVREEEAAGGQNSHKIEVTTADLAVASASAASVILTPSNQVTVDGATYAQPATYAICAVEVKA